MCFKYKHRVIISVASFAFGSRALATMVGAVSVCSGRSPRSKGARSVGGRSSRAEPVTPHPPSRPLDKAALARHARVCAHCFLPRKPRMLRRILRAASKRFARRLLPKRARPRDRSPILGRCFRLRAERACNICWGR